MNSTVPFTVNRNRLTDCRRSSSGSPTGSKACRQAVLGTCATRFHRITENEMMRLKYLLASVVLAFALTACADERNGNLSAVEAFALAESGEITLIDIRRPEEWRQTGVAKGVNTINMLHPQGMGGFAREVYATVGQDLDAPIVLICRTGNRTSRLQPILAEMGFTNVRHVPEGMIGSRAGPGWIRSGLPVEACQAC